MALDSIELIFLIITTLFFALLVMKEKISKSFCVLCVSVSITWLAFLALYLSGKFNDPVILAILMGESVTGIFYVIKKSPFKFFAFPVFLSLTLLVYVVIAGLENTGSVVIGLVVLWAAFILMHTYRSAKGFNHVVRKIINCCKNW